MRVVFERLDEPCVVRVPGPAGPEVHELWPVVVDVAIDGDRLPMRFVWDRFARVLRVDERWPGRVKLGDARAAAEAARVAREALAAAAEHASKT
ncbi:MAG: hypothetical protein KF901_15675 [Myxococcales bacterium]|nr:hypothetical protein [Myxococcales bacterium]